MFFRVVLRINAADPTAIVKMSAKYGADARTEGIQLLKLAKELGMDVAGVRYCLRTNSN